MAQSACYSITTTRPVPEKNGERSVRLFEIEDTKAFMTALLMRDTFKDFELSSGQITTFMTFTLDGFLHDEYLKEDEEQLPGASGSGEDPASAQSAFAAVNNKTSEYGAEEETGLLVPWPVAAPYVTTLIKGKKPPKSMKLVLRLGNAHMKTMLEKAGSAVAAEQVKGLFLNINYEADKVTCTTGTSMAVFTLDKSVDRVWDEAVEKFLNHI